MEVRHNTGAIMPEYKKDNSTLSKSLDKLSSGYRINPAGDEAAGHAVSEKINKQIEGLKQELINAQDGISMFSTFEAALMTTHSVLSRMRSIAEVNSVNDNQHERETNQREFEQLILEIDSIAQTDFNGIRALTGEKTGDGESSENFNATASGLGLDKSEMNLLTCENAAAALVKIGIATNHVSDMRVKFGKMLNHLEHKINNISQTIDNLSATESRLHDTDRAEENKPYPENPKLSQSAHAMLAGQNKLPPNTINLLQ
jgi:flagellin